MDGRNHSAFGHVVKQMRESVFWGGGGGICLSPFSAFILLIRLPTKAGFRPPTVGTQNATLLSGSMDQTLRVANICTLRFFSLKRCLSRWCSVENRLGVGNEPFRDSLKGSQIGDGLSRGHFNSPCLWNEQVFSLLDLNGICHHGKKTKANGG